MFDLIQIAYADSGAAAGGGMSSTLIMILLMVAVFYFLLIRPENKRKKEAEQMRSALKKGDYLTTIGGIYGRVVAVTDRTVVIETSEDRVRMEFIKSAIGQVGTLEQQAAAAQQRSAGGLFGRRKPAEAPAEEEPADELPAGEEVGEDTGADETN